MERRALEILTNEEVLVCGNLCSADTPLDVSTSESVSVTEPLKFGIIIKFLSKIFRNFINKFVSKNDLASSIKGVISTIHYHSSFVDAELCVFIKQAGVLKSPPAFSILGGKLCILKGVTK